LGLGPSASLELLPAEAGEGYKGSYSTRIVKFDAGSPWFELDIDFLATPNRRARCMSRRMH